MAALVDTCGWIEWLTDGILADGFKPYLAKAEDLIVPTCLQFELYKWVKRERGEVLALEVITVTEKGHILPLTTSLSLYAADLALAHKLSFADAIIYASACHCRVDLVTSDDHFVGLPGVVFLPKTNAGQGL